MYWMAGSTLKKGTCLQDGWLHIEARDRFTGVLRIEGRDRFTGWLAPH